MGFPLVTVTDSEPLTNTFTVSQEYYLRKADAVPVHTPGSIKYGQEYSRYVSNELRNLSVPLSCRYKWYIPFMYKRGSNLARETELVWIVPDQPRVLL